MHRLLSRSADPIDAHVAQRLKLRRELAGYTQDRLGAAVGVSFQMIQKYENGSSRVGATRLMKIAKVLDVPVSWFFEGFGAPQFNDTSGMPVGLQLAQPQTAIDDSLFHKKETIDLLKAYYALPEALRKHVLAMVQTMEPQSQTASTEAEPK